MIKPTASKFALFLPTDVIFHKSLWFHFHFWECIEMLLRDCWCNQIVTRSWSGRLRELPLYTEHFLKSMRVNNCLINITKTVFYKSICNEQTLLQRQFHDQDEVTFIVCSQDRIWHSSQTWIIESATKRKLGKLYNLYHGLHHRIKINCPLSFRFCAKKKKNLQGFTIPHCRIKTDKLGE